ncbi:MAG: hypothetical protein IJJ55_01080, partial [Clostridia bacterium]|nr:hypothetical protein [Clostridia bacterium]
AADNTDITSLYASEIEWTLDETTTTANKTTISGNGESVTVSVGAEQAVGTVTVTAAVGGKSDNKAITVVSDPTYAITVDNTITGGTVTTTPSTSATKGQTVTIIIAPNNGYQLKADSVKVNGGEVTVTNNTFTMPEKNVTVTAEFEQIKYTITWNDDSNNLIDTTTVAHGETPTHAIPTKASTAEFTYTFAGWTPTIAAATANATYTAIFNSVKRRYTVTWYNDDGSVLDTDEVEYGTVPLYKGAAPTKVEDDEYTYTFAGWTTEPIAVTGAASYTAKYTPVAKEAPKAYLDLLTGFSWLRIEKANAASNDDIVLTATKEEISQETIPTLVAYIAVYSEGALQSVHKYDFVSNAVTLPAAAATGDYKIFIWTDGENGMQPVIDTITAETTGNNKLF